VPQTASREVTGLRPELLHASVRGQMDRVRMCRLGLSQSEDRFAAAADIFGRVSQQLRAGTRCELQSACREEVTQRQFFHTPGRDGTVGNLHDDGHSEFDELHIGIA
jgi:hypothetical protein